MHWRLGLCPDPAGSLQRCPMPLSLLYGRNRMGGQKEKDKRERHEERSGGKKG